MGHASNSGRGSSRIKCAFVSVLAVIACRRKISHTFTGNLINSLGYHTVLKKRFSNECNVIYNNITVCLLKFDDALCKISGTNKTCPKGKTSFGCNIMNDLQHSPALICELAKRVFFQNRHRENILWVSGSW